MMLWLIFQTVLFESGAFYLLTKPELSLAMWSAFGISHVVACLSFTGCCWQVLPERYKTPKAGALSFLFFVPFSLPVLGMTGLTLTLLAVVKFPKKSVSVTWKKAENIALPLAVDSLQQSNYGAGALREILLFSPLSDRRVLAVSAIQHLSVKQSVPLLQLALKDLSDDVRLLAYASLEKIEYQINENLERLKNKFTFQKSANRAYEIAQQYWELCYLGLADGVLRRHYLREARSYLEQAVAIDPMAQVYLLLGRVLIAENEPHSAIGPLEKALSGGLRMKQVAPYLAEAAFIAKDYENVRKYMGFLSNTDNENLRQLKEYWLEQTS
ncbi:hypothetical protein NF212_24750 [Parasalinivibrio latis]|uniref:tetratricopeptide repeat protein n=1 Tax=Parasalinivibrio latis TaxID=2952610 RepID=UPI0030E3444C